MDSTGVKPRCCTVHNTRARRVSISISIWSGTQHGLLYNSLLLLQAFMTTAVTSGLCPLIFFFSHRVALISAPYLHSTRYSTHSAVTCPAHTVLLLPQVVLGRSSTTGKTLREIHTHCASPQQHLHCLPPTSAFDKHKTPRSRPI